MNSALTQREKEREREREKFIRMLLIFALICLAFIGPGDDGLLHCEDCLLFLGLSNKSRGFLLLFSCRFLEFEVIIKANPLFVQINQEETADRSK